ncbi:phosphomevalonate kinase [Amycolatopsis azurea]|uniref:phosphomevalonate kinase n=1 Tax=Amycolatopsis azurea DSM 43854 TaxID=1238180 RepID=M2QC74_9PSEU|nr:phosphomevalonate kinase [Amycolatopsis azurea]EMD23687.1 Phosphomevalonate kinase [Amycolatopsis azurea DSM 43854]OOC02982.1 phosphomevalonate kinase [Amycolatopsis azurea DSM 43854]
MNSARTTVRQAPGKLFIAGEYAVVEPGYPAVVVGVDRQVSVAVSGSSSDDVTLASDLILDDVRLRRQGGGLAGCTPDDERRARRELAYVVSAIDVMDELLGARGVSALPIRVSISSGLHEAGTKLGLGSSGAVTVATIAAVADHHGLALSDSDWFRLALLATARIDTGPSGADLAAGIWGGWLAYYAPDRVAVLDLARRRGIEEALRAPWPGFGLRRLPPPETLALEVGWTGEPASTTSLVSALKTQRGWADHQAYKGFLADTAECVRALMRALVLGEDRELLRQIRCARNLLARLDRQLGLGIFTPRLTALCDAAESVGGAGKPSGAGGGDCGIALVKADALPNIARLREKWTSANVWPVPMRVPLVAREPR